MFMPALVKPRAAHTLALLWHAAHPGEAHAVFLRASRRALDAAASSRVRGASAPPPAIALAGASPCGSIWWRNSPKRSKAMRRQPTRRCRALIGASDPRSARRARPRSAISRTPASGGRAGRAGGAPRSARRRASAADTDNAFSALANLLPPQRQPPRRRRSGRLERARNASMSGSSAPASPRRAPLPRA